MLDIQLLRTNIDGVAERLATRGYTLDRQAFQRLESERRKLQTRTQELQANRNSLSKEIGVLKASRRRMPRPVMAQVSALKDELAGQRSPPWRAAPMNSTRFWRWCPICRRTACRSDAPRSTTSR
jgi:seryl-tRNA synthetase